MSQRCDRLRADHACRPGRPTETLKVRSATIRIIHLDNLHTRQCSAYLGRTITIDCIYTKTGPRGFGASSANSIKQARQVHLKCDSRILCVATSSVVVTSPECERLLLDEKFALGQIFRHLRVYPEFSLLDVATSIVAGKRELRRTYRLETEGIACEILEVFPDRDMFDLGEAWLVQHG